MKATIIIAAAMLSVFPAAAQPVAPRAPKIAVSGASWVGVMIQEIDADRAKALKLPVEAGVEITRVEPDSPAEKAGLKTGDAILQYNSEHVEGMEQFSRLVRETPVGREVKLDIYRNGAPQNVTVKIGARRAPQMFSIAPVAPTPPPAPAERWEMRMPDMPRSFMSWRSSALGIECETLDGQLAQFFGVKEGVLVRSVSKNSAGEKAGIKAGDVITKVDDTHVATPAEISSRIRSLRGKSVNVVVMRDHKEVTVSVALDDEDRAGKGWFQNFAPFAPPPPARWVN